MQHKLAHLSAAVVFAVSVSYLAACPDDPSHSHGKPATPAAQAEKAPCSGEKSAEKTATTVAHDGKAPCAGEKAAGAPCSKAGCSKSKGVPAMTSTGDTRVDAVIAKLPKVTYKVGDESTCCEKTAQMMAEKSGKPMQFVIGEEVLDSHCAAEVRLTEMLEKELEALASVQFAVGSDCVRCPVTAKELAKKNKAEIAYRVAGVDFNNKDQAEKAVTLVSDALAGVKMSYKVGDESFCCDKMAGVKAKETGKPVSFVVAGEETGCENHAKLIQAQAKIRTAVQAALQASAS